MNYRQIKFAGRFSLLDFGVYIGEEVGTETRRERARPRITRETVPFMNGSYDFSRLAGKIVYDDQKLYYTFIIGEKSKELVAEKVSKLDEWLSGGAGELYDSAYPGWKFVNVSYNGMGDIQYYSHNGNKGRVTAEFTAAPYMQTVTGQLIDCKKFTPNADPTLYLYDMYGGYNNPGTCYWVRMISAVGGTFIVADNIEVTTEYADVPITNSLPRWWVCMPKAYGDNVFRLTALENCNVIEGTDYWTVRALSTSIKVKVSGSVQGLGCKTAALNATWLKTDYSTAWQRNTIPGTNDMRIISEGDPSLTINGENADIMHFAMSSGDLLSVGNAKSEPCRLQYCSVKERR